MIIDYGEYKKCVAFNNGYECDIEMIIKYFNSDLLDYYVKYENNSVILCTPRIIYKIENYKNKWNNVWFEYEKHNEKYMYIIVCFQGYDGKVHRNYLHRLIAATFRSYVYHLAINEYGRNCDLVVDHINGDTLDNNPYNLRYIPRTMNYNEHEANCNAFEMFEIKKIIGENQDKEWLKTKK